MAPKDRKRPSTPPVQIEALSAPQADPELLRREAVVRRQRAKEAEEARRSHEAFKRRYARNLLESCARAHGRRAKKDVGVPFAAATADAPVRWRREDALLDEWCGWGPAAPAPPANRRTCFLLLRYWQAAAAALRQAGEERGPEGWFRDHPLAPLFLRAMGSLREPLDRRLVRELVRDLAKLRNEQRTARYALGKYFEDLCRVGYPLAPADERALKLEPPDVGGGGKATSLSANRDEQLPDASSLLRRMGKGWELRFAGRTVLLEDRVGLSYLHTLVRRRGDTVNVQELLDPDGEAAPPAADEATDAKTIEAARNRVMEIGALMQEGLPLEQIVELEAEKSRIEKYLASSSTRRGRPRKTGEAEKARVRVAAAIRRALALIKEVHPEAAAHFSEHLQDPAGENPVYITNGHNWILV